jgi:flagellar L-ring protein precursor FlgH
MISVTASAQQQQQQPEQPQQPTAAQPQQPGTAPSMIRLPPRDRPGVPQGGYAANSNYTDGPAGYAQGGPGGSMFQAQAASVAAAHNGGNGGGIAAISVFAVPRPQPKLIKAHDLITIIIREESEVSSQGTSDVKRSTDLGAQVNQFVKLNVKNLEIENAITGAAPSVNVTGSRNSKGEATVDRSDSVIARITAEVVDVKPNGTLVIQARKKIKTDEEEQTLLASGICRVEDITPDNTVLSTQLFDLEFTKVNKGQVRNGTKTGGLTKLLDFLNPF